MACQSSMTAQPVITQIPPPPALRGVTNGVQQEQRNAGGEAMSGLTKAIVFSQYWIHIWLVKNYLASHDVKFEVLSTGLLPAEKVQALDVFQVRTQSPVLQTAPRPGKLPRCDSTARPVACGPSVV